VVILVDNRRRDLMGAALIAHHLDGLGVDCHLEPLETYRAVLDAYRPDLILFNHLTAGHLVDYSQRLDRLGVLTAVLSNEGILYDPEVLRFNAGRYHRGAHIDLFLCWNEAHRAALAESGFGARTRLEVVGVPRFDFYFEPWASLFRTAPRPRGPRPRVLLCTNFVFARYRDLPPERADRLFAPWKDRIPQYRDYRSLIETNYQARGRFLAFAAALLAADRFDLTLRPHPGEDPAVYQAWLDARPATLRPGIRMERERNITGLILDTDLAVSCETCTTSLESWIAGRPTVELALLRHPVFFHAEHAALNPLCERPEDLAEVVAAQLRAPAQPAFAEGRRRHLARWCASPDGTSSARVAAAIAAAIDARPGRDWSGLDWRDRRRAVRLRALRRLGLPYNYDPLLGVKRRVLGDGRISKKLQTRQKTITPADVAQARSLLRRLASAP
jgi:surface carbohydrate biosynthesis protein